MVTLWVDFQNASTEGVRLNCKGTIDEIEKKGLHLYEGQQIIIWANDEDENFIIDNMAVTATVSYNHVEKLWVAQYKEGDLKHESERIIPLL